MQKLRRYPVLRNLKQFVRIFPSFFLHCVALLSIRGSCLSIFDGLCQLVLRLLNDAALVDIEYDPESFLFLVELRLALARQQLEGQLQFSKLQVYKVFVACIEHQLAAAHV